VLRKKEINMYLMDLKCLFLEDLFLVIYIVYAKTSATDISCFIVDGKSKGIEYGKK
jgi:hypothetical protein